MVPRQREKKSKRSGSGFVRVVTFFCIFLLWFPRVSYSVRVPVADTSLHILVWPCYSGQQHRSLTHVLGGHCIYEGPSPNSTRKDASACVASVSRLSGFKAPLMVRGLRFPHFPDSSPVRI